MVTQKYIPTRRKILFGPQEMNTTTTLNRKSKFYINFDLSHFSMAEIFFVFFNSFTLNRCSHVNSSASLWKAYF